MASPSDSVDQALWNGCVLDNRRIARSCRKMLVHAAGCVYRGSAFEAPCASVDSVPELIEDYIHACNAARLPIRIPRRFR